MVVNKISHHKTVTSTVDNSTDSLLFFAYPELCKGLQNVSDTCFKPSLSSCYDEHDAYFHYVYMMEELKRAGIMLSLHLLPTSDHDFNVLKCPVFQNIQPFSQENQLVLILSLVLSVALFAILLGIGIFVTKKFRLVPRFRAFMQNEPYVDIVIAESTNFREMSNIEENNREARIAAEESLPNVHDLRKSGQQQASVSMANLKREESVQST